MSLSDYFKKRYHDDCHPTLAGIYARNDEWQSLCTESYRARETENPKPRYLACLELARQIPPALRKIIRRYDQHCTPPACGGLTVKDYIIMTMNVSADDAIGISNVFRRLAVLKDDYEQWERKWCLSMLS